MPTRDKPPSGKKYAIVNNPLKASSFNLSENVNSIYVQMDDGGQIQAIPVIPINVAANPILPTPTDTANTYNSNFPNTLAATAVIFRGAANVAWYAVDNLTDAATSNIGTVGPFLYNGVSWDRMRSNVNLQSVSDTTTATYTGPDIPTYNARAVTVLISVTAFSDTSYTPEVQWKDGAGNYRSLWQQKTAKTGAADTIINIGPGVLGAQVVDGATVGDAAFGTTDSATLNQLVQIGFPVPNIIRIKVTKVHAAGAFTGNFQVQGS